MQNNMVSVTIQKISLIILSIAALIFPLLFTTLSTDAFAEPKQLLVGLATCAAILLYGVQMVLEKKVRFRATPFDIAVLLFTLAVLFSGIFATNKYDSYMAFVPFLFAVFFYFAITNIIRAEKEVLFFVSALVAGAVLSGIVSTFAFFKLYLIPMSATHLPSFTTFGSLLDQALYLIIVLPLAGYLALPVFQRHLRGKQNMLAKTTTPSDEITTGYAFAAAAVLIIISLAVTVLQLVTTQKPLILPFSVGFQTGFAAISQETNVLKGFLLGSGFGTYITDFTRFKPVSYNTNQALWSFTFFRSSSFFLELLATTGFLGVISFLFIIFKVVKQRIVFLPLIIAIVAAFVLPFSPIIYTLFFIILGVFASLFALNNPRRFPELEFQFVALKQGLFAATPEGESVRTTPEARRLSRFLPITLLIILLLIMGTIGFFTYKYVASDYLFQESLVAASQNNGQKTYDLESAAIGMFPYRDAYYRIFAQTNLTLANALAASQPKNSKPNTTLQNNVLTLIQQSINAGRTSITVAPNTALNWNNLSSIYRSLIGFGQNAENFSILTNQQAIALDPNNPQQYVNLGGIYYQLGQWDNAQQQFTTAIKEKADYANAYYNLGHALESKNDLTDALQAYQAVETLVANDPTNKAKIAGEITALQAKMNSQQQQTPAQQTVPTPSVTPATTKQPIKVNNPAVVLPTRKPEAAIAGPTGTVAPSPTTAAAAAPTAAIKP